MADLIEDRDGDGIAEYLNVRIFVPDDASLEELAAAANVAARLAFECLSVDLPLGYPISAYSPEDSRLPIFIGRAARPPSAVPGIALASSEEANEFARAYRYSRYVSVTETEVKQHASPKLVMETLLQSAPALVLGRKLKAIGVIDLAARIGLESTFLALPLAVTELRSFPSAAVFVGGPFREPEGEHALPPGRGRIEIVEKPGAAMAIAISGYDAAGEAEAIRHVAERFPYVWNYGKPHQTLPSVAADVRRRLSRPRVSTDNVIFEKTASLAWEVETALLRFEEVVVPQVRQGSRAMLELRLSEPPAIRDVLRNKLQVRLLECGANPALIEVDVLSAYKQGYSWIHERLSGALRGARRIRIRFRQLDPAEGSLDCAIRWLQELYPIDEVLARDLEIPAGSVIFERMPPEAPHIYEVFAEDAAGRQRIVGTFDPRYTARPLFDRFPDYAHALVTTGWISAEVDGKRLLDERIETDPELFWSWYQKQVLAALADHLSELYAGSIIPGCAPHFGTLQVDVALSEPDYRIGIDEERISSLEALHEDIYFETLLFLDVLGQRSCGRRLEYAGRIIPRVRASTDGRASVRVRLTGKQEPGLPWREIGTPSITAIEVQANRKGLVSLELRIEADYPNLNAAEFHYTDISRLKLAFSDRTFSIEEPTGSRSDPEAPAQAAAGLVQWNTPIGPDECERIIRFLARYPEVQAYPVGTSYLGRTIWALEVKTPAAGRYFSQSHASLEKPVLLISGRQHANEVSSTSHILRLGELLATDPEYKRLLDRVIFVLHPMTNPDGAQLVEELREIAPGMMLHACYLGALGIDVTDKRPPANPIYPEAEVRPELTRQWKPSLILNPHGYPSHEWVQLFAGYSAWVRSRDIIARDWWIPRGWFIPHLRYTELQKPWVSGLLSSWSRALEPLVGEWNERMRRRYRKYGAFAAENYRMSFHENLLVHAAPMNTLDEPLEIVTEVPDEVAEGPWLHAMASAGLECSRAAAQFIADTSQPPQRLRCETASQIILWIRRPFAFARPES